MHVKIESQITCSATTVAARAYSTTTTTGANANAECMKTKEDLQAEIRYAIRLCERTARLYRRVQAVATVIAILGASAAFATVTGYLPEWVTATGAVLFAIAGAALIAVRPIDKAAQNEADINRYRALLAKSVKMADADLVEALEETHQGDAPEIEPLRDVAYNDIAIELGRPDAVVPLTRVQRLLAVMA